MASKRVLLFAPYFLPRRRVGSMRPFRFALHLREYGWEPTVLTIATADQKFTSKEADLLRDIRILEIEAPLDWTVRSESQLGTSSRSLHNKRRGLRHRILGKLDHQFPIDTWLPLFAVRFRTMARAVRKVAPHVVWATGDPWSGLVAGRWLSKHLGVPFVADFRDPWTLSEVRKDDQWLVSRWIDRHSERRIVEEADVVMFQAEAVENMYRRYYADLAPKTVTVRNSFDPKVFDDPIVLEKTDAAKKISRELHIGFFGRFRAMSPASLVVDILARMRTTYNEKADRVFIHSFGPLNADDAEYAGRHGVASQFVAHDAVPLQNALAALRGFDILLVSTEIRRRYIIPAKIFEYLAAGRPILSLSRNPEVAMILEKTGTGIQIQDPADLADLLARCVDAREQGTRLPIPFNPRREEIMKYEAAKSTGELARVLDDLVAQERSFSGKE